MPEKYAIDFGTTNSVVARLNGDSRETVLIPDLSIRNAEHHLIPTLLYVRDGRNADVLVGAQVRNGGFDQKHDNRLFRNFKRDIGANSGLEANIIDGVPWTNADAGRCFLQRLIQGLPCRPAEIEELTVTVPVAAFDGYGTWLKAALAGFPVERIRILDESTAAALGYAVTEPGATVLVSDFGGGTLDLSLVRLPAPGSRAGAILGNITAGANEALSARVISKLGVNLGGSDIDLWLMAEILARTGQSSSAGNASLLSACENAKIDLSTAGSVSISVPDQAGRTHSLEVTRNDLEALMETRGFFSVLRRSLDKLMGQAHRQGVFKEDISQVLLVGGTALVPSVQRTFDSYFRSVTQGRRKTSLPSWPALQWTVDNTSIHVDKPFTAVVEGALQVSAGVELDDRLSHGYGLRVRDAASAEVRFEEIIPAGSPYPSQPVTVHLAPARAQQGEITLLIGQIEPGDISIRKQDAPRIVPVNGDRPIRVPLVPPGKTHKPRLAATLWVDSARTLRLKVTDLQTHAKLLDESVALRPTTTGEPGLDEAGPPESVAPGDEPAMADKAAPQGLRRILRKLAWMPRFLPASQASLETLSADLKSVDSLVRFSAGDQLGKRADRAARLVMQDILQTGTPAQRASAVQHLYRFSWFSAEALFRQALGDADQRVREGAVLCLCKMRAPEAYRLAETTLKAPDAGDNLLQAAIWGVSSHPDVGSIPILEAASTAVDPEIRAQALEILGATGAVEGIPLARRLMDDPAIDVIYAATLSWVELAGQDCFSEMAVRIGSAHGQECHAIVRGFFHATNYMGLDVAGSPQSGQIIAALEAALTDELPETRIAVGMQLAWIHNPASNGVLREGFERECDQDVKAHLLRAAVQLASPVAPGLLASALKDSNKLVRQTAEFLTTDGNNNLR